MSPAAGSLQAHAGAPARTRAQDPCIGCPQVLAVPLAVRPLFPGGIMPVTVSNNQLIKELVELRRQG